MKPVRVLLADDEAPARRALRRALAEAEGVVIVGEAASSQGALELIEALKPDVIFLDIRMPGMSGLELSQLLRSSGGPSVVFVTAYEEYAVEAFEQAALDYVLKPVDPARIAETLRRLQERGAPRVSELLTPLKELGEPEGVARALLRIAGTLQSIEPSSVTHLEAAGNYVRVHRDCGTVLVRGTLPEVMERLGSELVRVHRSHALRVSAVEYIHRPDGNDPSARLIGGAEVPIGRTYWKQFERLLGG